MLHITWIYLTNPKMLLERILLQYYRWRTKEISIKQSISIEQTKHSEEEGEKILKNWINKKF